MSPDSRPFFSVIVATLGVSSRPSLVDTLRCIKNQSFRSFELITDDSAPNEYYARNNAVSRSSGEVLAFTDDDCLPPVDWLSSAYKYFSANPNLAVLTGPVEGDVFGYGRWIRVNYPYWFIGCNLFIRRSVFDEVGGFETDWGLTRPPRGWRSDTDIGYRIIDKFGLDSYIHAEDVVMIHPSRMKSMFELEVEIRFYRRHRNKVIRYIAPYDPRICELISIYNLENDRDVIDYMRSSRKMVYDWVRSKIHLIDYKLRSMMKILYVVEGNGLIFAGTGWNYVSVDPDSFLGRFGDRSFDVVLVELSDKTSVNVHEVLGESKRVSDKWVVLVAPENLASGDLADESYHVKDSAVFRENGISSIFMERNS